MLPYQRDFVEFAIQHSVLRFGSFTLKSGRVSPYFFNAGLFSSGSALASVGRHYAAAVADASSAFDFDVLFGPAYKGIPLAVSCAVALADRHGRDVPVAFNRKEKKDHGEGGNLVGAPLEGKRVLVLDDVITAGTAIREAVGVIKEAGGTLAGVIVAIDRQEKGAGAAGDSAVREVEREFGVPVRAIVTLSDVLEHLQGKPGYENVIRDIRNYREQYGI
ncbi:MAG: orotate phosphoribosyltransferase [Olpidium bornovanus]|uniref:orotate phosphoribosyltransferase n=1 Tax=Olpidium bornovanus TaxID=278681 RepID=A0A8H7ZXT5_9FUNG|nr:MAG: orotate phosphoribosyltransferase [Olpidium bornovanus]